MTRTGTKQIKDNQLRIDAGLMADGKVWVWTQEWKGCCVCEVRLGLGLRLRLIQRHEQCEGLVRSLV